MVLGANTLVLLNQGLEVTVIFIALRSECLDSGLHEGFLATLNTKVQTALLLDSCYSWSVQGVLKLLLL